MNDIQIYLYSGTQLRTIDRPDGLWWVLKDVCEVLGLSNPAMVSNRLDDDEKAEISLTYTSSNGVRQSRVTTIINEPGLYTVILRSEKPEAKAFKRWVTHDVLPSIRSTGIYAQKITNQQITEIAEARATLTEWESLEKDFDRLTADAGRRSASARKEYDDLRHHRENVRKHRAEAQNALDSMLIALICDTTN